MLFYDFEFLVSKFVWFEYNGIGNIDFVNIMYGSGI